MKELLYWHNICGHYDIGKIQRFMKIRRGGDLETMIIPRLPGAVSCNIPLCRLCLYGKGRLISMHSVTSKPMVEHSDVNKESYLLPGDYVSLDQYKLRVKGWLPNCRSCN